MYILLIDASLQWNFFQVNCSTNVFSPLPYIHPLHPLVFDLIEDQWEIIVFI